MSDTATLIDQRLRAGFAPEHLQITDDSHKHAGHAGAAEHGGGHFAVHIVSAEFAGKTSIQRHRMVYDAMGELMRNAIHALSIQAQTPDEYIDFQKKI